MCDPPRIYPSLPEYTLLFNKFTCANLPKPTPSLPEYTPHPFQQIYMCSPPIIYTSLLEYTSFSTNLHVRPSQNLTLPPRIYPPFQQIYMCEPPKTYPLPPRIYPPPLSTNLHVRPYQNMPLPPRFSIPICDPPRIYPFLTEYPPPHVFKDYMRPSQKHPLPPRIYPSLHQLYTTLPELTFPPRIYPPFRTNLYVRHFLNLSSLLNTPPFSTTIDDPPRSYPPSQNIPLSSITICDPRRIYTSLPEYTSLINSYYIMRRSQNLPLPPRINPTFDNYIRYSHNLPIPLGIYGVYVRKYTTPSQNWKIF